MLSLLLAATGGTIAAAGSTVATAGGSSFLGRAATAVSALFQNLFEQNIPTTMTNACSAFRLPTGFNSLQRFCHAQDDSAFVKQYTLTPSPASYGES